MSRDLAVVSAVFSGRGTLSAKAVGRIVLDPQQLVQDQLNVLMRETWDLRDAIQAVREEIPTARFHAARLTLLVRSLGGHTRHKPDAHQLEVDTVVEALILAAVDVLVDPALPLGGDAERCTSVF